MLGTKFAAIFYRRKRNVDVVLFRNAPRSVKVEYKLNVTYKAL